MILEMKRVSEFFIILELSVGSNLQIIVHLIDLLLVNLYFWWLEDWGLNKGEVGVSIEKN